MRDFQSKYLLRPVLLGLAAVCTHPDVTQAQELTIHGALTSDYVFRGISNSDGHGAVQAGLDVSSDSGLFGGIWATTTDITAAGRNRRREIDYYIGYVWHFDNDWSISVSANRYSYPGSDGNVDYDYTELSAVIGISDRFWIEIDHTDSVFGHNAAATNVEALGSWPLPALLSLSAGVGRFDVGAIAENAYLHWHLGVSRPVNWATVDLRYHDTSDVPERTSRDDLADPRIVLTISAAF